MSFDFVATAQARTVRVAFAAVTPSGASVEVAHVMRRVTGRDLQRAVESWTRAGMARSGDAREEALQARLWELWREYVERVEGYGDADSLSGRDLHAYFGGESLPADLEAHDRAIALDMMRAHVAQAVVGWIQAHSLDSSFRR